MTVCEAVEQREQYRTELWNSQQTRRLSHAHHDFVMINGFE